MRVCFFDCETTGLLKVGGLIDQQPKIIDIGLVLIDPINSDTKEVWESLVNPACTIPDRISKLTGIYAYHLCGEPSIKDVLPTVQSLFDKADILVAHNAYFDVSMLQIEAQRSDFKLQLPKQIVCTVDETVSLKGYKLSLQELWGYVFGGAYVEKHRALSDALDLCEICSVLRIPIEAYYDR